MISTSPLYDLTPLLRMALFGLALALLPLGAWAWRQRGASPRARLHALTLLTLFLTFDLVLFGAFTRLSDSGLGCPDWPGCYGNASPLGAHADIQRAQSALPGGPVTHGKAWIEMVHRYLATAVGVLIAFIAACSGWWRRRGGPAAGSLPLGWPCATLLWVCLQGAFGALTVTMKLYPAIVTLHLLGGLALLALLAAQSQALQPAPLSLPSAARRGAAALLWLVMAQVALGGWVSTNYAVLACRDVPTCQGTWWPEMNFAEGFTVWRSLGEGRDGGYLPFAALTAIHVAHRAAALVVLSAWAGLAWRLWAGGGAAQRRWAVGLVGVGAWQLASGVGNVVLGWPLAAALAHTGGAAAMVVLLTLLLARARQAVAQPSFSGGPRSAAAAPSGAAPAAS